MNRRGFFTGLAATLGLLAVPAAARRIVPAREVTIWKGRSVGATSLLIESMAAREPLPNIHFTIETLAPGEIPKSFSVDNDSVAELVDEVMRNQSHYLNLPPVSGRIRV